MPYPLENAIEKSIDIYAPLHTVYNQWTQFEDYPKFMEWVREVKQIDEKRLHWCAVIEGREQEWDSAIVEQTPGTRITWKNFNNAVEDGMVSFTTIYEGTRVTLQMTYDPEQLPEPESKGDPRMALSRRVERVLQRFKEFIEAQGTETGAWHGEIQSGQVVNERASDQADTSRPGQIGS